MISTDSQNIIVPTITGQILLNSVSGTIPIGTMSSMSNSEIMHWMYPLKSRIDPSATEICKPRVDNSFNSGLSNKGLYRFSDHRTTVWQSIHNLTIQHNVNFIWLTNDVTLHLLAFNFLYSGHLDTSRDLQKFGFCFGSPDLYCPFE